MKGWMDGRMDWRTIESLIHLPVIGCSELPLADGLVLADDSG